MVGAQGCCHDPDRRSAAKENGGREAGTPVAFSLDRSYFSKIETELSVLLSVKMNFDGDTM